MRRCERRREKVFEGELIAPPRELIQRAHAEAALLIGRVQLEAGVPSTRGGSIN